MGEKILVTQLGEIFVDMQHCGGEAYRLRRRAVVFAKGRVLRHVGVEVDHLVTVVDPVRETPDHQVLPGEGLEHGDLLLLGGLVI